MHCSPYGCQYQQWQEEQGDCCDRWHALAMILRQHNHVLHIVLQEPVMEQVYNVLHTRYTLTVYCNLLYIHLNKFRAKYFLMIYKIDCSIKIFCFSCNRIILTHEL